MYYMVLRRADRCVFAVRRAQWIWQMRTDEGPQCALQVPRAHGPQFVLQVLGAEGPQCVSQLLRA